MFEWVSENAAQLGWIGGGLSVAMFLATLLLAPFIVVRLPKDIFVRERKRNGTKTLIQRLLQIKWVIIRNILGVIVISMGVAMLVLPGQGVLTILLGLGLISFPGKWALIRSIVRRKRVNKTLNWIRAKGNKEPFIIPQKGPKESNS